jgi:hypothetical protein
MEIQRNNVIVFGNDELGGATHVVLCDACTCPQEWDDDDEIYMNCARQSCANCGAIYYE